MHVHVQSCVHEYLLKKKKRLEKLLCSTNEFLLGFRYGRPDPSLERAYDISVKIRMSSVRYLHTMRFLKEVIAFCSHFPQLIDAFQRMKAMARGDLVSGGCLFGGGGEWGLFVWGVSCNQFGVTNACTCNPF